MIKEVVYSEFIEEEPVVRTLIDNHGREVLSKKPVSIPFPQTPPASSFIELMHRLYADMHNPEVETFEDADDFDVPDELGIEMESTPYEQNFDHLESSATPAEEPSVVSDEPEKVTE